jgi:cytochrome d ubiquinol oxidase subunit I
MDTVLLLSRLQFAITAAFHFIFVPLTLGLSILVAFMESRYLATGDKDYLRMAKFWGRLFLINFALGVVTGITLEFQFGMNWAEYSRYVGDIFGSPLAIEATVAFFLESTFLGVWIFGWNRISPKLHALSMWLVALATNLSALWILIANGWMQNPVGYVIRNARAEMVDFWAVVTNPYGILKFFHTIMSGWVVAGFFVLGISAYHILRKNETEFFKKCFKIGAIFALVSSILVVGVGDFHAKEVAKTQPTKFAAMESLWETTKDAPMYLLLVPDPANEKNSVEAIGIPKFLSILSGQKEVKGLKEFPPQDRPPVTITFISFRLMVVLGFLFIILAFLALIKFKKIEQSTTLLRILVCSIPLPYIAAQLGWIVAEVGRQPWIVYGLLRTADAISKAVEPAQVMASFIGFTIFYGALGVIDIYLLSKYARKGPETKEV